VQLVAAIVEPLHLGAEAGYYRRDLVRNTLQKLNANVRRAAPSISESSEDCREQSAKAGVFCDQIVGVLGVVLHPVFGNSKLGAKAGEFVAKVADKNVLGWLALVSCQSLALRFRGGQFAFELFNLAGSPPLPFIFWHAAIYNLLA
jgi:hypothetical protein